MTQPTLVFDLDGTLADTNRDLIPVLNRVTAGVGLPAMALDEIGQVAGYGAKAMIVRSFAFHERELSDELLEQLFALFLQHYEAGVADNTVLFDGVIDAMDALETQGWQFAVCTNKLQGLSEKLLQALEVAHRFKAIVGADRFAFRKPDPRHLWETIAISGGERKSAIMVGDSKTDIATAKAAGVPVIAVDFGYSDVPVSQLSPDRIISHFNELPEAVAALPMK